MVVQLLICVTPPLTQVRSYFDFSKHWKSYDPFSSQKLSAFRSSGAAIEQLSQTLEKLIGQQQSQTGAAAASTEGIKVSLTSPM